MSDLPATPDTLLALLVELEVGNLDAAGFENRPEGGCSDALAQRGHDTTGNKDVFGHDTGDFWKGE